MLLVLYGQLNHIPYHCMVLEYNQLSCKTDWVMNIVGSELPNIEKLKCITQKMTEIIQVENRNIGILYQNELYFAYRRGCGKIDIL